MASAGPYNPGEKFEAISPTAGGTQVYSTAGGNRRSTDSRGGTRKSDMDSRRSMESLYSVDMDAEEERHRSLRSSQGALSPPARITVEGPRDARSQRSSWSTHAPLLAASVSRLRDVLPIGDHTETGPNGESEARFRQALLQLLEVHEQEMTALREENMRLRGETLPVGQSSENGCKDKHVKLQRHVKLLGANSRRNSLAKSTRPLDVVPVPSLHHGNTGGSLPRGTSGASLAALATATTGTEDSVSLPVTAWQGGDSPVIPQISQATFAFETDAPTRSTDSPNGNGIPTSNTSNTSTAIVISPPIVDSLMAKPEISNVAAPPGLLPQPLEPVEVEVTAPVSSQLSTVLTALPRPSAANFDFQLPEESVLTMDLSKMQLPRDLIACPKVRAALKADQKDLMTLRRNREFQYFTLEGVWAQNKPVSKIFRSASRNFDRKDYDIDKMEEGNLLYGGVWSRHLVLRPNSTFRVWWDTASAVLLSYDILAIPFLVGFDPPRDPFVDFMGMSTMLYWTFDILASLMTGYNDKQHTILSLNRIMMRYLKTWFLLDIFLVTCDWLLFVVEDDNSAARMGRSLRVVRFARALRLMRLIKVKRILQEVHDQLPSEAASIGFRIVKIVIGLIIANHIVACCWYLVGSTQGTGASSWVQEHELVDTPLSYRYALSLHWALTQFTPASMEVVPSQGSVPERVFAVVVIIIAMITFSSFVSILTASMEQLRKLASDESRQFWLLRRFLRDWGVPKRMSQRIQRYLEYVYGHSVRKVQSRDVQLLQLLSEPLHNELMHATLSVHLRSHPFFSVCGPRTRMFSGTLSTTSLARGDVIFSAGQQGRNMYCVCKGGLLYVLGEFDADDPKNARVSDPDQDTTEQVAVGSYISEPTIWTKWLHVGDLEAMKEVQLISINAVEVGVKIAQNASFWQAVRQYAELYVKELNKVGNNELTDLTYQVVSPQDIVGNSGFKAEDLGYDYDEMRELEARPLNKFRRTVKNVRSLVTKRSRASVSLILRM